MAEASEDDWSSVKVGDRVRLENGDGSVEFDVVGVQQTRDCWHIKSGIADYAEWHWKLSKLTPALPTEPGIYADNEGAPWVLENGRWFTSGSEYKPDESAPFTRLESQADTARKVLERMQEKWNRHPLLATHFREVAAEFGVSL